MSTKYIIIGGVVCLVIGLAVGRFSLPAKVVVQTKTVEVIKQVKVSDIKKSDNSVTTVTQTKKPDGTVTTVTETKADITTKTEIKSKLADDKKADSTTTTTYDTRKLTVSLIGATRLTGGLHTVYGGQVQYRFLGPLVGGVMGLSDGTAGVSLGITF